MTHRLNEAPIEQLMVEHYLFDIGCSIETVSEISGMDEESVRKIHDDYIKFTTPGKNIK